MRFGCRRMREHQDGYFKQPVYGGSLAPLTTLEAGSRSWEIRQAASVFRGSRNITVPSISSCSRVTSPNDVNYNVYIQDPVYNHADTVAPSRSWTQARSKHYPDVDHRLLFHRTIACRFPIAMHPRVGNPILCPGTKLPGHERYFLSAGVASHVRNGFSFDLDRGPIF